MNSSFFDGDSPSGAQAPLGATVDLEEFYGEEEVVTACDQPEFVVEEGGDCPPDGGGGQWYGGHSSGVEASAEEIASLPQHVGEVGAEETAIGSDGDHSELAADDDDLSNLIMVANEDEYDEDEEEGIDDEEEEEQDNLQEENDENEEGPDMLLDEQTGVVRGSQPGGSVHPPSDDISYGEPHQQVVSEEIVDFDSTISGTEDISATGLDASSSRQSARANSRLTAYMLFSREMRDSVMEQEPQLDFSQLNKRLGALWSALSTSKKYNYRRRAQRLSQKALNAAAGLGSARMKSTGRWAGSRASAGSGADGLSIDPARAVATGPLDLAAHLLLLGESLETIGRRLCDREGQIAVQGALSVVLDSLMCALVPLVALTQHVEPLAGACDRHQLQQALDNVAYFMPGL